MVKEHILNSFISSNLHSLGIEHVSSEVPKPIQERRRKKTDILGFDQDSSVPIILELKVRVNEDVVKQLHDYIVVISNQYPTLFEELVDYRKLKEFKFNYSHGIVGMVLSPEPPPEAIPDRGTTILWAQFAMDDDQQFRIVSRRVLSKSSNYGSSLGKKSIVSPRPCQFVAPRFPNLAQFANRLDEIYLSVSPTIYPRYQSKYNYVAYYGKDTRRSRSVYGFNTGATRSEFKVQYHISVEHQPSFYSHASSKKLSALGLKFTQAAIKPQILETEVQESFASNVDKVSGSLALIGDLADLSYQLVRVTELDSMRITDNSRRGLCLSAFGMTDLPNNEQRR